MLCLKCGDVSCAVLNAASRSSSAGCLRNSGISVFEGVLMTLQGRGLLPRLQIGL